MFKNTKLFDSTYFGVTIFSRTIARTASLFRFLRGRILCLTNGSFKRFLMTKNIHNQINDLVDKCQNKKPYKVCDTLAYVRRRTNQHYNNIVSCINKYKCIIRKNSNVSKTGFSLANGSNSDCENT